MKSTRAKEENERLWGEMKGADSDEEKHRMNEGEIEKCGGEK